MHNIPDQLRTGPITARDAARLGVSQRVLSRRFRQILPQVYLHPDLPVSIQALARAALMTAPPNTAVAGVTALQLYGIEVGDRLPIRLVSTHLHPVRRRDLRVSRVRTLPPTERDVCVPSHALLQASGELSLLESVAAGDSLVRRGLVRPSTLTVVAAELTGPGSCRARRVAELVRDEVDSPEETRLRLSLVLAGLPEPTANPRIGRSGSGRRDLVLRDYKLILEYEGDHHRVDEDQWNTDIRRHEGATLEGWLVLRVTKDRIRRPRTLVRSVYQRLVERGYRGPEPDFSDEWRALFDR